MAVDRPVKEEAASGRVETLQSDLDSLEYAISHDLRSPLRAMEGFSAALEEDYAAALDAQGSDYVRRIRRASARANAMVDGLLRLNRVGRRPLTWSIVDLTSLAEQVMTTLRTRQPDRDVTFKATPEMFARADPELLRTLVTELLENAWAFTATHPAAAIEFTKAHGPDGDVFCVCDNGIGFNPGMAGALFRPFGKLDAGANGSGIGIGLAVAKRIIDKLNGAIWATSTPGQGANFYFTLGGPHE